MPTRLRFRIEDLARRLLVLRLPFRLGLFNVLHLALMKLFPSAVFLFVLAAPQLLAKRCSFLRRQEKKRARADTDLLVASRQLVRHLYDAAHRWLPRDIRAASR